MCMPYFSKIFGNTERQNRRNNIVNNGGPTPLNSLVNVQQVSLETTSSMNTSTMSSSSSKSVAPSITASPFLPERPAEAIRDGNGSFAPDAHQPSGAVSMAVSKQQSAASASGSVSTTATGATPAAGSKMKVHPNSWWSYLGMNKNKKTSIESL